MHALDLKCEIEDGIKTMLAFYVRYDRSYQERSTMLVSENHSFLNCQIVNLLSYI